MIMHWVLRRRAVLALVVSLLLGACGEEDLALSDKAEKPSPHGVVLLFDENMRKFSDISTCMLQNEAMQWVTDNYPLAKVADKGWASTAYYYIDLEFTRSWMKVYFDGTIVNLHTECYFQ